MPEPCRCPGWSRWWQGSRWQRIPRLEEAIKHLIASLAESA